MVSTHRFQSGWIWKRGKQPKIPKILTRERMLRNCEFQNFHSTKNSENSGKFVYTSRGCLFLRKFPKKSTLVQSTRNCYSIRGGFLIAFLGLSIWVIWVFSTKTDFLIFLKIKGFLAQTNYFRLLIHQIAKCKRKNERNLFSPFATKSSFYSVFSRDCRLS